MKCKLKIGHTGSLHYFVKGINIFPPCFLKQTFVSPNYTTGCVVLIWQCVGNQFKFADDVT